MCLNQNYCLLDEIEAGLGKVCVTTVGGKLIPRNHLRHGEELIAIHHEEKNHYLIFPCCERNISGHEVQTNPVQ